MFGYNSVETYATYWSAFVRTSSSIVQTAQYKSTRLGNLQATQKPDEFKNHMYKREFNNSILTTQRHTNEKQEKRSDVYISLHEKNVSKEVQPNEDRCTS